MANGLLETVRSLLVFMRLYGGNELHGITWSDPRKRGKVWANSCITRSFSFI